MKTEKRYVVFASPFNGTAGGFYLPVVEDRTALADSAGRGAGRYDGKQEGSSLVTRPVTLLRRWFPSTLSRKVA